MSIINILAILAILTSWLSCNDPEYYYTHPIPFNPETYISYRVPQAPVIDGLLEDEVWQDVPWTKEFVDIEGLLKPEPEYVTTVKMAWDDIHFYIAARLDDRHIWATLTQRDTVIFQDNNFEVFIDPDGDTHKYIELEMNAFNTVWDLYLERPYREDRRPKVHSEWDIEDLQTAVHINGTLNNASVQDSFWTLEIAIPWLSITQFTPAQGPPKAGDQWRVNFSRVAWHTDIKNGRYEKTPDPKTGRVPYYPQENWVWSPSGFVNMHQPETWGYVQFSEVIAGTGMDEFEHHDDEKIKWALRQLYYQQRVCKRQTGKFSSNLRIFAFPEVDIKDYKFAPHCVADSHKFTITATASDTDKIWLIRQDGKVWLEPTSPDN